ncbi:ECF RNA polymerase sigma factor SigM [Corynebacterium heidelbergense]|nr:ECF RNA polymerase sigma factor SigM [Corynebacterium heidelbergense]
MQSVCSRPTEAVGSGERPKQRLGARRGAGEGGGGPRGMRGLEGSSRMYGRAPRNGGCEDAAADRELLRRHQQGCGQAFDRLLHRHRAKLSWVIRASGVSASEHSDVFQEGVLRMHRSASSYSGASSVATWMTAIMRNTALSFLRDQHRRFSAELTDFLDDAYRPDILLATQRPREPLEERLDVARSLQRLDPDLRIVLVLTGLCGYTTGDVARRLGVPEGTVKSRKFRASQRMRQLLGQVEYAGCPGR